MLIFILPTIFACDWSVGPMTSKWSITQRSCFFPLQQGFKTFCHPMISSLPKPVNRLLSRFYSESQLIVWYPWKQLQGLLLELQKILAHNCTIKMMKKTKLHAAEHSVSGTIRVSELIRPISCPRGESSSAEGNISLVSHVRPETWHISQAELQRIDWLTLQSNV